MQKIHKKEIRLNLIKKTEISLVELNKNKHPDKEKYFDEYKDYIYENIISTDYNIYNVLLEKEKKWKNDG